MTEPNDLVYWEAYFLDRVKELKRIVKTPWGFAGACVLLEVLSNTVNGAGKRNLTSKEYIEFVEKWLPTYSSVGPKAFKYNKRRVKIKGSWRKKTLSRQMYYILRCGLVHNFSFVAGTQEIGNGASDRSIWMVSRKEAKDNGLKHLQNFTRTTPLPVVDDAAVFVGEDFLRDICDLIKEIFKEAATDTTLKSKIVHHLTERTPIGL